MNTEPTHKTYRISHVSDLLDVPTDRLPICVLELAAAVSLAVAARPKINAIIDKKPWWSRWLYRLLPNRLVISEFSWIDDGKFTANITTDCGRVTLLHTDDWTGQA